MLLSPVAVRDPVNGAAFEYSSEASHWRERTFPDTPSELEQACIQVNVGALGIAIAQVNATERRSAIGCLRSTIVVQADLPRKTLSVRYLRHPGNIQMISVLPKCI